MTGYAVFSLITLLQFGLLAQATDALGGHAGRVGVASVLFAAIGGYAYALLTVRAEYEPWWTVFVVLGFTAGLGFALGWILMHLRGHDFLLGTIAAQMGFLELANNLPALGGPLGIRNIPPTTLGLFSDDPALSALWILIPGAVFSGILLQQAVGQRGYSAKMLHWVRDDPISAYAFGISANRWQVAVFTMHAMLSGLAGTAIVVAQGYVSPRSFDLWLSLAILTVVYISGTGGNPMAMYYGAAALLAIGEVLRSFGHLPELVGPIQQIATNVILIGILAIRRRGIAGPVIEVGPSATRLE